MRLAAQRHSRRHPHPPSQSSHSSQPKQSVARHAALATVVATALVPGAILNVASRHIFVAVTFIFDIQKDNPAALIEQGAHGQESD